MNCRSCGNKNIQSIFSFGEIPLANRLLKAEQLSETEPRYNLEIMLCEGCGLVQLKDIIDPAVLFSDYLYFSSNAVTMLESVSNLIDKLTPTLPKGAKIVEIASNDGYLLQYYQNKGFDVLGIEPAKNIAEYANAKGITTQCEFFTEELADILREKQHLQADIIHANNVMAHVPDINDFALGIKKLLASNGQAIIEVPYLLNLINNIQFDTIYHEHVYYFSLSPLLALFSRHGLMIFDVEQIPVHGGSLRIYVGHEGQHVTSQAVSDMHKNECQLNIKQHSYYQAFANRIASLKTTLCDQLNLLKKQNNRIAAYGASAKGTTLLNYFGIGNDIIDFVVDLSPIKHGYHTPGTHLKINPVEYLSTEKIDYTLLLTWNFSEEILKQQEEYRAKGGKFILPLPEVSVI